MLSLFYLFHRVSYEVVSKSLSSVTCTIPNAHLWNHNGIQSQSSPLKICQRKGMLASSEKQYSGFASCLFIALGRRLLKDNKKTVTATCICIWFSCSSTATSWGEISQDVTKMSTKSSFSPGPRRSALPQSLSGSLEVCPSSGSPSPCPAVSKGGESSRKGARSRSPRGGR